MKDYKMSHSWTYGKTSFIGNSDLSGDITIRRNGEEIDIPGAQILKFVADHIRDERIRVIEQMTESEILGFSIPYDEDDHDDHEKDAGQKHFQSLALPLLRAIASWEKANGSVAAIMPSEYADFCEKLSAAAVTGSARGYLSVIGEKY